MFQAYDNGGATIDRFTIYQWRQADDGSWQPNGCITTDGNPRNFWQHSDFDPETVGVNEKRIPLGSLPRIAQAKLIEELEAE